MNTKSTWTPADRPSVLTEAREVLAAAVFHYQRCFFGPNYKMKAV